MGLILVSLDVLRSFGTMLVTNAMTMVPCPMTLSRCLWRTTCRTLTTSAVGKSTGDVAGSTADRPSAGVDGQNPQQHKTFAAMLRNSKFVQIGDPVGKGVVGKIYHIVNDDLYIDFGGKFPAVCTANRKRRALYTRGTEVRLLTPEPDSRRFIRRCHGLGCK